MKVAIVAYGHSDNVICLSRALSKYLDMTVFFVTSGDRFVASIFNWDVSKMPFGVITDAVTLRRLIEKRIAEYIGQKVKIYVVHTPNKSIAKDIRRHNFRCIKETSNMIKRQRYDIVHFNGSSGFQLYFHFLLNTMPKVYTIHDYIPHSGESNIVRRILNTSLNKIFISFTQHQTNYETQYCQNTQD